MNDTYKITRGISSIYTKKYDVAYEYKCLIKIQNFICNNLEFTNVNGIINM